MRHTIDKVFINEIADLELGTPSLLGSHFQNLVESVAKKKADSTAALTRKIESQFKQQLETARKQNGELQKKIGDLTKASAEAQKLHDEQVKASQKQLDDLAKGNGIARQKDREQMEALQKQLASLTETSKSQSESLTKQLGKMREDIGKLTEENKDLAGKYTREKEGKEALERTVQEMLGKRRGTRALVFLAILVIIILIALLAIR